MGIAACMWLSLLVGHFPVSSKEGHHCHFTISSLSTLSFKKVTFYLLTTE